MSRLEGKVALVTGGTRGIGAGIVEMLAREGAAVAFTGRSEDKGAAVEAAVTAAGGRVRYVRADNGIEEEVAAAVRTTVDTFGSLTVLVNNAIYVGPAGEKRFLDTPPDEIENRIFGNIAAQLVFTQPILRHMVERGGGVIANVTSAAGYLRPHAAILGHLLGRHVDGERAQRVGGALVGTGHQLVVVDLVDVGLADPLQRLVEDRLVLVARVRLGSVAPRLSGQPGGRGEEGGEDEGDDQEPGPVLRHRGALLSQSRGSCGRFSTRISK